MKFELEYIKHDRPVTIKEIEQYGRLADHDLKCPILLMYELGKLPDRNGIVTDVDNTFLTGLKDKTNSYIQKLKNTNIFSKFIAAWKKPLDKLNAIPLIKDHKSDNVDGQVGYTEGLVYAEQIEGTNAIFIDAIITDVDAKKRVEQKTLRPTSLGTRTDGSIKEISFVVNPAAPLCGLMFSEPDFKSLLLPQSNPEIIPQGIQFAEESQALEFSELEFAEKELKEVIIPNHIKLTSLIKKGKVLPFAYDDLLRKADVLKDIEKFVPSNNITTMYGSSQLPTFIDNEQFKTNKEVLAARERLGLNKTKNEKTGKTGQEMIKLSVDHMANMRQKELNRILEFAELDPNMAINYIKAELGTSDAPTYKDASLDGYKAQLSEVQQKLNNLRALQL